MQPLGLCYAKEKSYQFASEMTSFFFKCRNPKCASNYGMGYFRKHSTSLIRTDTKNLTDLEKTFFVKGFYVIYTISISPVTSCSDYNDGLLTIY